MKNTTIGHLFTCQTILKRAGVIMNILFIITEVYNLLSQMVEVLKIFYLFVFIIVNLK